MAEALQGFYPGVQFGTGPAIEASFYHDIDTGDQVTESEDLPRIEVKMLGLAYHKETLERKVTLENDALDLFKRTGQAHRLELINDLEDGTTVIYT